jgi:hypothetical protein
MIDIGVPKRRRMTFQKQLGSGAAPDGAPFSTRKFLYDISGHAARIAWKLGCYRCSAICADYT